MTKKQFKAMVDTRDDFNRELQYLKNFSVRGAEKIVTIPDTDNNLKITKWQMETKRQLKNEQNFIKSIV